MTTDRRIEYLPLDEITAAERNPKDHDEEAITASLRRFGTIEVIVRDDRTGRLISGHGRVDSYRQARDAGEDPPDGVKVDDQGRWLAPIITGWASRDDTEAEAALIAVNRLGERGGWRTDELSVILDGLRIADALGPAIGYDLNDLDALLREVEAEKLWADFGGEYPDLGLGGGFDVPPLPSDIYEYKIRTSKPAELLERLGYEAKDITRRLIYWPADLPPPEDEPETVDEP